jgi:hypothetical protein
MMFIETSGYPDLIEATSKRIDAGLLLSNPCSSRELSAQIAATLRANRTSAVQRVSATGS